MDPEEPGQGRLGHVRAAAQQEEERRPDDRHRAGDLRAHGRRPVRALVPGQEVAGEPEPDRDHEHAAAHDPGQLARVLVGRLEEDPEHVQDQEHDHQVRGPVVDAPDEPAELDVAGDGQHALVGAVGRGAVVQRQQRPGDHLDPEQEERDPAEVEGLRVARDADVEQGADERRQVEPGLGPVERAPRMFVAPGVGGHRQPVTM